MSAPLEELKKAAQIDVKDHMAIFDHYIALGREIEQIAIKFGYNVSTIVTILTGYGEVISDKSRGRLNKLSQHLVKEYVEHFYPGIASENPQNHWINIEAYLDVYHQGWKNVMEDRIVADKRKGLIGRPLNK